MILSRSHRFFEGKKLRRIHTNTVHNIRVQDCTIEINCVAFQNGAHNGDNGVHRCSVFSRVMKPSQNYNFGGRYLLINKTQK